MVDVNRSEGEGGSEEVQAFETFMVAKSMTIPPRNKPAKTKKALLLINF